MKKILPSIIICFLLIVNSTPVFSHMLKEKYSSTNIDDLDDFIINKMQTTHLPGLSASIVIDDIVMWQKAYGLANVKNTFNVTNETLFKIASVSKTVTATALMQLYEQGYFNLSDPINEYLPYSVINPLYPSTNITFHMLLTHSSSINDNWEYLFYYVGDAPIPFQTFLEEYLVPGGLYYDAENNFCLWEPGTYWEYSNIAVALIGYLVEVISNVNFTDYVQTNLFTPLDMNESAWYLRDLNESHIAMPYHWDGDEYIPYGHIGYVDVPAGDLRTSTAQLIHFLTMFINNGSYNQQQILENSTVELMLTPQLPFQQNIGLIWWKNIIGGRTVWGHNGVDFGARAMMYFDPSTHIGVVVFTNGESDLTEICDVLFDYAETIVNFPPETPMTEGPNVGVINVEYMFNTSTIDPNRDQIYYMFSWGDETYSEWLGPFPSGTMITLLHSWSDIGEYEITVKAKDMYNASSNWSEPLIISIIENDPPISPDICGPSKGKPKIEYTYTLKTTDSDNNSVFYYIEWGDGSNSNWIGPYPSGEVIHQSHTWSKKGSYLIKAKAKDIFGIESNWGTLTVTMPYQPPQFPFLEWLLERFPHAFPILRHLMGY